MSATMSCGCGQRIAIDGRELAAELNSLDRFER